MKKFLQFLVFIPWVLAPIACTQNKTVNLPGPETGVIQNVATDDAGKAQDGEEAGNDQDLKSTVKVDTESFAPGDHTATMPVYSQQEAEEVIQDLLNIDTNDGLLASLNAAGFAFADLGELTKALKVGDFPPKVVDQKLLQFFYSYDPVFGNKVDFVQEQSSEEARNLKTKAALLPLVVMLDIVYKTDVVRDGNRNFVIGDQNYKLTITETEYFVEQI